MNETKINQEMAVTLYNDSLVETKEVPVVPEKPLTLFMHKTELATMVCSPTALRP